MILSMTGFGRSEAVGAVAGAGAGASAARGVPADRIEVEVRSVNHRGLKVALRLPERLLAFQQEVEDLVRERVGRGTVTVSVEHRSLAPAHAYVLNRPLLVQYARELAAVQRQELRDVETAALSLERIASLPGAIEPLGAERADGGQKDLLLEAVARALDDLEASRRKEGEAIAADISARRLEIGARLGAVKARIPSMLEEYQRRLKERIDTLLKASGLASMPDADLGREVAYFADRTDISEEVSRLDCHLQELDRTLAEEGPVGRKLDFLAQEMLREANTMGSKTQDSSLVRDVLAIKLEVDKIKEQVQNVE